MTAEQFSPATRIGHRERELAVQALADHYSSGRLTGDEYSERVAAAWEARTASDLGALFGDLPAPRPDAALTNPPAWPAGFPVATMDPAAPYGRDPRTGRPFSDKSKIVAGILQLFLPFGIGRFYSGHTGLAVAQLLVTFFTAGIGAIWPFIDGIVLLAGNPTDPDGRPMRT